MVRHCVYDDYLALREFRISAIRNDPQSFTATLDDYKKSPLAYWKNICSISEQGTSRRIFVVDNKGLQAMASIGTTNERLVAQFSSLWVVPWQRNQGYATAVYKASEEWAKQLKHHTIQLRVKPDNQRALDAYLKWGFKVVSSNEIILMQKNI